MGAEQSQLGEKNVKQNNVGFFINGKEYNVKPESDKIGPESRLIDFIRDKAGLTGTKYMCREGGCGACVVTVKSKDPNTGSDIIRAVNSCLTPVFSADGWEITTVEGLGNRRDGYHQIQKQVVHFSATQCGYCTPGMVMNMYSLSKANPGFKSEDVENSLDGNLCRCTGYRPIMDAFKSMANDASEELRRKCAAIENENCNGCPSKSNKCYKKSTSEDIEDFEKCSELNNIYIKLESGEEWITATSLENVFTALQRFSSTGVKYRVVAGNTGTGVFKNDGPYQAYIDINGIPELKESKADASGVKIGSGVTLSSAIDMLQKASELDGYSYTAQMSKHIKRVANVPVRNVGTLGGNLMMKHAHKDFPSDIFLLLETAGAELHISSSATLSKKYSMTEFRELDMNGKLITMIELPAYKGANYIFRSFKITRRYQNAHAYVNGAILIKTDPKKGFTVMEKPRIVFGGISPEFVHASQTEAFLNGKTLNSATTVQGAMDTLENEVLPDNKPSDASPEYRKSLTQALLYKAIIGILGDSAKSLNRSGGQDLEHGKTYGKQVYDTDEKEWPLYKPIPKIEAAAQASGEAEYVNDIPPKIGELFGAFVLTTVANAKLTSVDASEAMMIPGVVKFIQAKDIPGRNNYAVFPEPEEIFIKENVGHAGQAVGLVLADNREAAFAGAKKVMLTYANVTKPVLDIKTSLQIAEAGGKMDECILEIRKSPTEPLAATQTIKGEFRTGAQYHLTMETQTCISIPREDGMDVFAATQFPDTVQSVLTSVLNIPAHDINIEVRRLGGGYGAKITRSTQVAAACAVAAYVTNRPVRVVLDLETNMKMIGKRLPYMTKYEAGVDDNGNIVSLKAAIFCDTGFVGNESTSLLAMICMQSCYRVTGWQITPGRALTNTPGNTSCRAPGSTQGIASIEAIMEHIAHVLKKDPLEVRMTNLIKAGDPLLSGSKFEGENPIPKMIEDIKLTADFAERKRFVDGFNQANRFRKRGLSVFAMRYPVRYAAYNMRFPVFIAVYHQDGTVAVSHGGMPSIEMGQGLNTKCAQTVARFLNIPLEKVRIKPTNNVVSPNAGVTGGATGSELVCHCALEACKKLLEKMAPVRETLKDPTWEKLVTECHNQGIMLTAQHQDKPGALKSYDVWGVCITEVDVDVLTGENKVVRVDLLEDAGMSLSPEVDIGQIEGAFIMGLGLWTTEKLIYDKETGELLTCNTWEYKPPFSKDIPEDFRVTLMKNRPNPFGVLRSKATGEPPLCMSVSVLFAIKNAIDSARKDAGNTEWYQLDGPVTPEDIQRLALTSKTQFDI